MNLEGKKQIQSVINIKNKNEFEETIINNICLRVIIIFI